GHEHNMQYIEDDGIKQLISGSGSKVEEVRAVQATSYSLGKLGFATLKIYDNQQVDIAIHKMTGNGNEITFQKTVVKPVPAVTNHPEVMNIDVIALDCP